MTIPQIIFCWNDYSHHFTDDGLVAEYRLPVKIYMENTYHWHEFPLQ